MPIIPLNFTPNTAFSDHIKLIQASNYDQGLDKIHEKLKEQFPGADISFTDVCREILEQSKSYQGEFVVQSYAFADQFSEIFEREKLLDRSSSQVVPGIELEERRDYDLAVGSHDTIFSDATAVYIDIMKDIGASASEYDQTTENLIAALKKPSDIWLLELDESDLSNKSTIPSDCYTCIMGGNFAEQAEEVTKHEQVPGEAASCYTIAINKINSFEDPHYEIGSDEC